MKIYQKYLIGALFALFIVLFYAINPILAADTSDNQPAEIINYNEPVDVNSALMATLPSYFLQGMHVGSADGSGGVLFANGTIINVSRTRKDNKPVPVTLGDDLRVDGEIWRGTAKGISDNMPLKVSDVLAPTLDDIYDLGESSRRWQDLYLSGTLRGNNATFTGDIDFSEANITGISIINTNNLYVSEDSDSSLTVPSTNPVSSKNLIGRVSFLCTGSSTWQEKEITLPDEFQDDETKYAVTLSEHLPSGASYDYLLSNYNAETPDEETLLIRASCRSGESGIGLIDWQYIGY